MSKKKITINLGELPHSSLDSERIKRIQFFFIVILATVFFASAQLRGIYLVFGSRMSDQIGAIKGVVDGLPHWRMFQSRVLGPYFTETISSLTGLAFNSAYRLSTFLLLSLFFITLIIVAKQLLNSVITAFSTAIAAFALNFLLMQGAWLYSWDFIDLTVFTMLVWGIISGRSLWVFTGIMAVETFNREIVVVLGLWFLIDAILRLKPSLNGFPNYQIELKWKQVMLAVAIIVIGYTIIEILRNLLLVKEIGPEMFAEGEVRKGQHNMNFQLPVNLRQIYQSLTYSFVNLMIPINFFILGLPFFIFSGLRCKNEGVIRASFLYLILYVATLVMAVIYETRVWICFVPYVVICFPIVFANSEPVPYCRK